MAKSTAYDMYRSAPEHRMGGVRMAEPMGADRRSDTSSPGRSLDDFIGLCSRHLAPRAGSENVLILVFANCPSGAGL